MTETYTNRELGMMLSEMKDETIKTLTRIEEKVDRTNGRVKKLELWRMVLLGAWAAITFMLPLIVWFTITTITQYKADVQRQISAAIQEYDKAK